MDGGVYKGFRAAELEYQFNPRVSVPEFPQLAQRRSEKSRIIRHSVAHDLDVRYGDSPRQTLDVFPGFGGPVLIFIHGGYWRSGNKEDHCGFVPLFVERGATVALVEYDLCPSVTIGEIVRQIRTAVAWVFRNVARYGADPGRLYVCGHSAGAHLGAMALAHDWAGEGLPADVIKGAALTSGVYDLEVVMRISVNDQVRLTPELAREFDPFRNPPRCGCPVLVAVGGDEPTGWRQMSLDYFEFCRNRGVAAEFLVVPGANHYTVSDRMADPEDPLARAVLRQMGL
ncbi:MAG TPA: alpha/beta hydrolase [candidate division Zixibacteria bacterium]|nr:alpha/beta hydrolase [candidate division Zixibacteria bacterium]